jgi:hypothetical protein
MKKILLILTIVSFAAIQGYSQAEFNTGALITQVSEYGEIELFTSPDTIYMLDRASILVATSPTSVFDWWNDADVEEATVLVGSPALSDYEIYGAVNNAYSGLSPNVIVKYNIYGWNNGGYVIVKFNVTNNETDPIDAMIGLDIIPYINEEWGYDSVTYIDSKGVIWFHRGNVPTMGMKLLSAPLTSLYSFEWYEDYQVDEDYWTWMNYGSVEPEYVSTTADGPVAITSQAGVMLNNSESTDVFYAMALGNNQPEMLGNITAAEEKYNLLFVGIGENGKTNVDVHLGNYPNPVRNSTTFSYQIPAAGSVSLKIYDATGNEVAVVVNANQRAGSYTVSFNTENLPAGMYSYTLKFNDQTRSNKMLLAR